MSMNEGMVWIEEGYFKGWHCSECSWAFSAIHMDTTVAVLAFNRAAQKSTTGPTSEKSKVSAQAAGKH